jgi:hypothetical protein
MTDDKPPPQPDKTPWEKFTDLARRVIPVPKSELPKDKPKKHKPT